MGIIGEILGTPLGYVMKFCFDIFKNYGLSIIVFTLITKVILFPISMMVQKNSVKMIKMKPELDALKYQYSDDKDGLFDAQNALYKKEKYSPFASIVPLVLQIPLIFGLIDVVYKPLTHLLHLPKGTINAFTNVAQKIAGTSDLGSSPELKIIQYINDPKYVEKFKEVGDVAGGNIDSIISKMQAIDMSFFGFDLSAIPSLAFELLLLIPILAGVSALIMCIIQNKINVLQVEQNALSKWGMTAFMIAFSTYFAFLVPAGVGVYWIFGNLFSIPVMYLVNVIYNPKQYIDYKTLNAMKAKAKADAEINKANNKLSKQYYKEICKKGNLESMELMFYSEQSGFYKYFQNIIEAILANSDITIHYVTSDPNDAIFKMNNPRIVPYYIAGNQLITLMMKLECKMVVMTMPDLEKYHIKRSKVKKDIEYVFIDHACSSFNLTYRPGALDYFDTVFVVSKNQGYEVRQMEELRGTHKKRLIKCGYGLIDNMIAAYNKDIKDAPKKENQRPSILIAPSWQYDNILDSCLDNILGDLLAADKYKITVRPHPQYIRRFPMQMEAIIERYKDRFSENFEIQTDFSSNSTVYSADLLITDWSCIAYEYSFTTNKPTLFVDTQMKVINKDYKKIKIQPFDIWARNSVGKSVTKEETAEISKVIDYLLVNYDEYADKIEVLKNEYFYNLGTSGEYGARYIIKRLRPQAESQPNNDTV